MRSREYYDHGKRIITYLFDNVSSSSGVILQRSVIVCPPPPIFDPLRAAAAVSSSSSGRSGLRCQRVRDHDPVRWRPPQRLPPVRRWHAPAAPSLSPHIIRSSAAIMIPCCCAPHVHARGQKNRSALTTTHVRAHNIRRTCVHHHRHRPPTQTSSALIAAACIMHAATLCRRIAAALPCTQRVAAAELWWLLLASPDVFSAASGAA